MTSASQSSAQGIAWDLADLYRAIDDARIAADLTEARRRAEAFESAYRGKIAVLTPQSATALNAMVRELEDLFELMDKPAVYASLVHAARTDEPAHGALLSRTREERTAINKHLIFFDLEWVQLPDATAHALLQDPALAR
jgi:oligoendopeptidase F